MACLLMIMSLATVIKADKPTRRAAAIYLFFGQPL
jgi:hypothetical protein